MVSVGSKTGRFKSNRLSEERREWVRSQEQELCRPDIGLHFQEVNGGRTYEAEEIGIEGSGEKFLSL